MISGGGKDVFMRGLRCKRGLATTVSWAGTGSGPRRPLAPPVRAFIWVQLRERRERERKRSCVAPGAPAKPAFLSARRRHCHFHYALRFIPPHSTHPQKHIRCAAASLQICHSEHFIAFLSFNFRLSSVFFLCSCRFPHTAPYLCNALVGLLYIVQDFCLDSFEL